MSVDERTGPSERAAAALAAADEAFAALDVDAIIAHLAAAIREFDAAGDPIGGAMACVRLGDLLSNALFNMPAARAWFGRAARLVADLPPCVEQGWVALAAMGCDVGDPEELRANAELALDRARRFGDVNLETKALADGGLALVQSGAIPDGMAMLDEAMALACGPADAAESTMKSVCSFFTACYYAADFDRVGTWGDLLRRRGLIGTDSPATVFLNSHCESVQATLLYESGRWTEAEDRLVAACRQFEEYLPMPAWHPAIVLADLRVSQGRLAEAEALLNGKDGAFEALLPMARLHLARGEHDLARRAARRGLRALADDRLRAAQLLTVLVDAELGDGDIEAAEAACDELRRRVDALDVGPLLGRAHAACARLHTARGDTALALDAMDSALESADAHALPWLHLRLLTARARLRDDAGDVAGARHDASAAQRLRDRLDVVLPAEDAAALERLARPARSTAPAAASMVRDGAWWSVRDGDTVARLRHTKGLAYVAILVASPGQERHALDLVDRVEGVDPDRAVDRRRLGDAGELADPDTRRAYRRRVEALRAELEDATDAGLDALAESLQTELDALVGELSRAFGLDGRQRVAGSAAEKARLNVTRAVRAAVAKIVDALPEGGAALDRGIRTGTYCSYAPPDGDLRWIAGEVFSPD